MSDAPLVLHVDDYESARYARTRTLQQAGFRVVEAGTAAEALRLVAAEPPALALIDVKLPDMNGSELCRRLKAAPAGAGILVVHVSAAFRRGSDYVRGLEQGADAYLVEPVEPDVLVATLRALLRTRRAEDAVRLAEREWRLTFEIITASTLPNRSPRLSRSSVYMISLVELAGSDGGTFTTSATSS